ncbi:MAG: in, partial [Solirubrobacteraceae bacterium]|nr:in [Solirubrobacteraceae bacterium]
MASAQAPGKRTGGARSAGAAARVCAAILAALAATPAVAAAADPVTAQAVDANAAFLAWAPPPATPTKVCVVDTGVSLDTDVAPAVAGRFSVYPGTVDDVGAGNGPHGTYVAGVIASQDNDGSSVGIWPQARIVAVRVFTEAGGSSVAAFIKALSKCREVGSTVVNLSLSGLDTATGPELDQLENKIADLRTNWSVNVVAAAGNNSGPVAYPARFPSVFAVGAADGAGVLCSFSNRGAELDLSTLGCPVELSYAGGGRATGSGTSFSAPVVSGVLAALRAYRPDLTVGATEALLIENARPGSAGPRLDAAAAFRAAGLGGLVDAADPTPRPIASPASIAVPGPASSAELPPTTRDPAPRVVAPAEAPAGADALTELNVRRPTLRSRSYRRGILTVMVSGVPDFGEAVFMVDGRRYVRASGRLRIRLARAPRRISVIVDVPGVGHTGALRVRVKRAAEGL